MNSCRAVQLNRYGVKVKIICHVTDAGPGTGHTQKRSAYCLILTVDAMDQIPELFTLCKHNRDTIGRQYVNPGG